jgi:hypothetical protein
MFIIFMDIAILACINSAILTSNTPKTRQAAGNCDHKRLLQVYYGLTTNSVVVTDAGKYVTQKQEQIDILQKLDERIQQQLLSLMGFILLIEVSIS